MDVRIEMTTAPKEKPQDMSKVSFGSVFTDHMFMMDHDPENGWHNARIVPYGPISGLAYGDDLYEINNGDTAQKIYGAITDIQWGRTEDKYGWCVQVG